MAKPFNEPQVVSEEAASDEPQVVDDSHTPSTPSAHSVEHDVSKEKGTEAGFYNREMPTYTDEEGQEGEIHLDTAQDIVTTVIDLDDDPSLSPWTFRMFFIGMGLSCFGAVLEEIYNFKPQVVYISISKSKSLPRDMRCVLMALTSVPHCHRLCGG